MYPTPHINPNTNISFLPADMLLWMCADVNKGMQREGCLGPGAACTGL